MEYFLQCSIVGIWMRLPRLIICIIYLIIFTKCHNFTEICKFCLKWVGVSRLSTRHVLLLCFCLNVTPHSRAICQLDKCPRLIGGKGCQSLVLTCKPGTSSGRSGVLAFWTNLDQSTIKLSILSLSSPHTAARHFVKETEQKNLN